MSAHDRATFPALDRLVTITVAAQLTGRSARWFRQKAKSGGIPGADQWSYGATWGIPARTLLDVFGVNPQSLADMLGVDVAPLAAYANRADPANRADAPIDSAVLKGSTHGTD